MQKNNNMIKLTNNQRLAILRMLESLCGPCNLGRWQKDALLMQFDEYELQEADGTISRSMYYSELNNLPLYVKRDIILNIFSGWCQDCRYDQMSLHESFTALISLKICSAAEYFFYEFSVCTCMLLWYHTRNVGRFVRRLSL